MARSTPAQKDRGPPGQRGRGEPQGPQRGDAAGQPGRAQQRPLRGVRDCPDHDGGPVGGRGEQLRGLHVGDQGAGGCEPRPLSAVHEVVHGDDLAGPGAQSRPPQLAGQQRG
jgi:hypothetical protein